MEVNYDNDYQSVTPLLREVLALLEQIKPGEIYYAYAEERLRDSDRRKSKGPYAQQD